MFILFSTYNSFQFVFVSNEFKSAHLLFSCFGCRILSFS
ncbi:hypothetical protein NC99_13210 [Sunxiuqinia dokdonensis]|uniref:Uncharacterized protein n=1 Tax=Sunxiuqinia dokdonensis TaxID=1409788 RepID=A0A0L8VBR5_9BACT|nr:hypothetical protein NC99_13210 [Sunxiuqinia dokdonensis]